MAIRWDKFTVKSQQAIQQAQARAAEFGNPELQPVHLLLALLDDREGALRPDPVDFLCHDIRMPAVGLVWFP